jgi:dTDP-4-dehydrorhamnose reductase
LNDRWLVTGATGMLGRAFIRRWPTNCVGLVRKKVQVPFDTIEGDLENPESVDVAIRKVNPSICFHFAACTNLPKCEQIPSFAYQINTTGSATVAKACASINARVIYMCTDSIFDGLKGNYKETDTPSPLNVYAESKLKGELKVLQTSSRNISVRGNIFGKEEHPSAVPKLYDWAVQKLKQAEHLTGFIDVVFNPVSADTLANILGRMAIFNLPGGCWNVGTKEPLTKEEFIRLIAKANSLSDKCVVGVAQKEMNLFPARPLNTSLNLSKIRCFLGDPPSIEEEVRGLAERI